MENIVIFGGSFDPIHNGHLRIASAASMALNADVVFVPAKNPRWKKPMASPEDRVAMLKLALKEKGISSFSISLFEIKSEAAVNYTIDTIRYFQTKYKKCHLHLLLGADAVNSFPQWKDADEIAKIATPCYVNRPGVTVDAKVVETYHMEAIDFNKSGQVSSSAVRAFQNVDIPFSVLKYIEDHQLYYMPKIASFYSEHRMIHALSVANLALKIAQANHCQGWRSAYIAGLLHDMAKKLDKGEAKKLMLEHYPEYYGNMPDWSYHQFLGAYLAQKEFGITDPMILDAIEYHTSGRAHMPPISKIVYSSDKIEPTRGWDSRSLVKKCMRNYYVGFLAVMEANKKYLESKNVPVSQDPLSKECAKLYLGEKDD